MAASAGAIRAGKAFVEVSADSNPLVRGLRLAEAKLRAFGASFSGVGRQLLMVSGVFSAGGVAGIAATAKAFGDMGGTLVDLSARTGVSVEALSGLEFAASQTGAELGTIEIGLKKMQDTLVQAAAGSQSAQTALARLGVSVAELAQLTPDQQFSRIAEAISRVRNPALRTAFALDIFGKSGTQLLPLLNEGAAGLATYQQQAADLGLVLATEDAQAADDFGDSLATLWIQIKAGAFSLGAALLPELHSLVEIATRVITRTVDWVRINKAFLVTVGKIALGVAAAGVALVIVEQALLTVGAVFGMIAAALPAVVGLFATLGSAVAALATPVGLVAVGVLALGTYFVTATDTGVAAVQWLQEVLGDLWQDATAAFAGIRDALVTANFGLAMRIVGLLLKLEWQKALGFLEQQWLGFQELFLSVWTDATFGLAELMTAAWALIQTGWEETLGFLTDGWTVFTNFLMANWDTAIGFIRQGWVLLQSLFDDEINVAAEVERINQEVTQQGTDRQAAQDDQIRQREQARQERLRQIGEDRQTSQQALQDAKQTATAQRQDQTAANRQGIEQEVADARAALADSIAAAAQQRAEAEQGLGPRQRRLRKNAAGASELGLLGDQKVSTQGSFNAAGIRGLAGGNAADRTAKATEENAKNTQRRLRNSDQGNLQVE
ncbi:MAG: phage tail tape measure protein [Planctomycetaceae bacterium]